MNLIRISQYELIGKLERSVTGNNHIFVNFQIVVVKGPAVAFGAFPERPLRRVDGETQDSLVSKPKEMVGGHGASSHVVGKNEVLVREVDVRWNRLEKDQRNIVTVDKRYFISSDIGGNHNKCVDFPAIE